MKSIIIKYSKYILTLLAVAAMAVGLLMPTQIKAADSYNKDKKGSITINLDDVKQGDSITNKANVSISIYQVASISHDGVNISFDIVSSLKSTGVDVNDITTSDKNLNSAKKLTTVIDNSGISAVTKQIVTVKLVLRIWRRECILSKKKTALLMGCFLHF